MRIQRLHAEAVIDDHAVAVDAEEVGEHHDAGVRREHRRLLQRGEIEAEVHLLVDLLVVEEIGAAIGKARFDLRVAHRRERLRPTTSSAALFARQRGDGVVVLLAQVAVDLEEALRATRPAEPVSTFRSGVFEAIAGTTRSRNG